MLYFFINIFLCFIIGVFYSISELLARFKNGKLIFKLFWGYIYLIFNGVIAVLCFLILKEFDFNFLNYDKIEGGRILVSGASSMAILRSWLISVPVKGLSGFKKTKNIEATLAPLIQIYMDYVQREFDKEKAKDDLEKIKPIMQGLDFEKAILSLPYTCSIVLKTMTLEDGKELSKKVNDLKKNPIDNSLKLVNLGIILSEYTGHDLLEKIASSLKSDINTSTEFDELNSLIDQFKD